MKTIIAGSRTITDLAIIDKAVQASGFVITELVEGGAKGVDALAKVWAEENGLPITEFKADWKIYGRGAGPVRNQKMAEYADALIAVWDGESRGTKNMISLAKKLNLKCFIYIIQIKNASWFNWIYQSLLVSK